MVQSVETRETPLDPLILDFARPGRTLFWMGFVLVQAAILVAVFWVPLETAFRYNPIFNGVIVAVLAVGILVAMFQVARLNREIRWLQAFSRNESAPPPRLLAPLARQLTPLDHRSMHRSTMSNCRGHTCFSTARLDCSLLRVCMRVTSCHTLG